MSARWFFVLLGAFLLSAAAGCANSQKQSQSGAITVHTIERDNSNSHLVLSAGAAILVDAGSEGGAADVAKAIREFGVEPKDLKAIIVTHGHADHAGGAGYFQREFGTPVIAGRGDAPMFASGRNDKLCPTGWFARRLLSGAQAATYQPFKPDVMIDKQVSVAKVTGVTDFPGLLVPVPGHTPGSVAVIIGQAAFIGDILRGGIFIDSATRHFFMCDIADNDRDIKELLSGTARDVLDFYTGHMGPVKRDTK